MPPPPAQGASPLWTLGGGTASTTYGTYVTSMPVTLAPGTSITGGIGTVTFTSCTWEAAPVTYYSLTSACPDPAQQREVTAAQLREAEALRQRARAAEERYEREREERRAGARAAAAAAFRRAEDLLLRWLSDDQARDYRDHAQFDVAGSDGSRWRISCCGQSGNVRLLNDAGEWVTRYCAHPPGGLPDPDAWLAQALVISTDVAQFLAVANVHATNPALRLDLANPLAA